MSGKHLKATGVGLAMIALSLGGAVAVVLGGGWLVGTLAEAFGTSEGDVAGGFLVAVVVLALSWNLGMKVMCE